MPDLRVALRTTQQNVAKRYSTCRDAYIQELDEVKKSLEAMEEWVRIAPEDQSELGTRATRIDVPDKPAEGRELADLRLLLARKVGVAGVLAMLRGEVLKHACRL